MPADVTKAPRDLESIIRDVTGPVEAILGMIDVAEEEIARAKQEYPSKADLIDSAFTLFRPTDVLQGKCERVYRAHARELAVRIARGRDTRPGTAAEVLCGLLGAATIAPLNAEGGALAERLFGIVMRQELGGEGFRPVWKGQVEEAFAEAQRKTRQRLANQEIASRHEEKACRLKRTAVR